MLSTILDNFHGASEQWAVALVNLLEPSFLIFAKLAFLLLIISLLGSNEGIWQSLLIGLLIIGFGHVLLVHGWEWAQSLSHGVRTVSGLLGVPAYDPSAIVTLGKYVAEPLQTSVANQGLLSYIRHPTNIIFALTGDVTFIAFCILALVQFCFCLLNYLLIALAPFMLLWFVVPGLSAISDLWVRLFCGNLAGLFVTGLIAGIMRDLGRAMGEQYQMTFANAAGVATLTLSDYAEPLATSLVLAIAYAWVPFSFSREAATMGGNIMAAGRTAASLGVAAWTKARSSQTTSGSASSESGETNNAAGGTGSGRSGGGGGGSLPPGSGSGGGGGSMGPAQAPSSSQWGGGNAHGGRSSGGQWNEQTMQFAAAAEDERRGDAPQTGRKS